MSCIFIGKLHLFFYFLHNKKYHSYIIAHPDDGENIEPPSHTTGEPNVPPTITHSETHGATIEPPMIFTPNDKLSQYTIYQ